MATRSKGTSLKPVQVKVMTWQHRNYLWASLGSMLLSVAIIAVGLGYAVAAVPFGYACLLLLADYRLTCLRS